MLDALSFAWIEVLYRPIYNLLIFVYNFTPGPSMGWAIIAIAIFIRVAFLHFTLRGFKTDLILESVSPYFKKIEEEEKHNPKERRKRITQLLKGKDINVYSEVYTILAQFLFLIVLYQVFQVGLKFEGRELLYDFVPHPKVFFTTFAGIDLARGSFILSFSAAFILFLEQVWEYNAKKNIKRIKFSEKWFPLLLGVVTYILLSVLPSAKALFILVSVLFSILLRLVITISRSRASRTQILPEPANV